MNYTIVNPHEADLHSGKISIKSPVQPLQLLEPAADLHGGKDPQRKGHNGHQILGRGRKAAGEQVGAHQYDVAGLGVGEHLAPAAVGVGVLEPAGHSQKRGGHHGL